MLFRKYLNKNDHTLRRKQMIAQIKDTLLNAGLNVAQINDYASETEEKSFTVFAYYLGRYVTMTIFYADHTKYVHVSISALVYHATQIEFADGCLDEALVEACNFVKQYTQSN